MAALMVLVIACTLAQVHLGTFGAVKIYMRSWLVYWDIPGTVLSLPVFPGGALAGFVLAVNLLAAQGRRLELSFKKAGLWVVHAGLILLVVGEFVTGMYQRDDRLSFEVGETTNYVSSPREVELAVVDTTDPGFDEVYSVPGSLLARSSEVRVPGTPLTIRVRRFMENAQLSKLAPGQKAEASAGVGTQVSAREVPPVTSDDAANQAAALVEPLAGGRTYGTWLVSNGLGAPQSFVHEGHTYALSMRERREYLPYALTLRQFKHDVYPGTDIPKNSSSLVHLSSPPHRRGARRAHLHEPAVALRGQGLLPGELRQERHPFHPAGGGEPRLVVAVHLLCTGDVGAAPPLRHLAAPLGPGAVRPPRLGKRSTRRPKVKLVKMAPWAVAGFCVVLCVTAMLPPRKVKGSTSRPSAGCRSWRAGG